MNKEDLKTHTVYAYCLSNEGIETLYPMEYMGINPENEYVFYNKVNFTDNNQNRILEGDIFKTSNLDNFKEFEKPIKNLKKEIMDDLADIWNKFISFENQTDYSSQQDNEDFCNAIHTCQRIIATQELRKQYPEFFK